MCTIQWVLANSYAWIHRHIQKSDLILICAWCFPGAQWFHRAFHSEQDADQPDSPHL